MSRAPIEMMLDGIQWTVRPPADCEAAGDVPIATHEGVLELFGHSLRCYRLSTGVTVFHADDFEALMRDWMGADNEIQKGNER